MLLKFFPHEFISWVQDLTWRSICFYIRCYMWTAFAALDISSRWLGDNHQLSIPAFPWLPGTSSSPMEISFFNIDSNFALWQFVASVKYAELVDVVLENSWHKVIWLTQFVVLSSLGRLCCVFPVYWPSSWITVYSWIQLLIRQSHRQFAVIWRFVFQLLFI